MSATSETGGSKGSGSPESSRTKDTVINMNEGNGIAKITGAIPFEGFTIFKVHVTVANQSWNIYRRYSWFENFRRWAQSNDVRVGSFPKQRWLNNMSDEVVQERVVGLQRFLDDVFERKERINDPFIWEFFRPIRRLSFLTERITFKSFSTKRFVFMDPWDEGDTLEPEISERVLLDGGSVAFESPLTGLEPYDGNDRDEVAQLRAELRAYRQLKGVRTEAEAAIMGAMSKRLSHLVEKQTQRQEQAEYLAKQLASLSASGKRSRSSSVASTEGSAPVSTTPSKKDESQVDDDDDDVSSDDSISEIPLDD